MIPTISYAITAYNEHEELGRLLTQLHNHKSEGDEIVVQLDTNATEDVRALVHRLGYFDTIIEFPLNKDFATFKNNIKDFCKKDYIVFIDADEVPNEYLI